MKISQPAWPIGWSLLLFGLVPVFAQTPTDSLNGKTIHLFMPSEAFTAFYFQVGDVPLVKQSRYEYSLTFSGRDPFQQDFYLTSNGTAAAGEHFRLKLGKAGISVTDSARFQVADFQGQSDLWIIVDPAGPLTAPPVLLLQAPRMVNILNPWPTSAPRYVSANLSHTPFLTPDHCDWYSFLLLDSTQSSGHFEAAGGTEAYGKGGWGSSADYDFAALFTNQVRTLWLNSQTNAWSPVFPKAEGQCQYSLAATVRDMSKDHPDFEYQGLTGDFFTTGMVLPKLGLDRKPVSAKIGLRAPLTYGTFDSWWITDTTNAVATLRSYPSCVDIPLKRSFNGDWKYESYVDSPVDHGFFPAEGAADHFPSEASASCAVMPPPDTTTWTTNGPKRNFNFCVESHASFIYQKNQAISLRGDDDIWAFIDGNLVIDLGGAHTPKSSAVDLNTLGLIEGREYPWDFFYCDRQPCGSALRIQTNINFRQPRGLDVNREIINDTAMKYRVIKRIGTGECPNATDPQAAVATHQFTYTLVDGAGVKVGDLVEGVNYGGILIATPFITLDTVKMQTGGLAPGNYRVEIIEAAAPALTAELPFRVPGSITTGIRQGLTRRIRTKPLRQPDALGRKFPEAAHKGAAPDYIRRE